MVDYSFKPRGEGCAPSPRVLPAFCEAHRTSCPGLTGYFYPERKDVRPLLGCPVVLCEAYRTSCPDLMGIHIRVFNLAVQAGSASHTAWQQLAFCVLDAQHRTPGPTVFDRHQFIEKRELCHFSFCF